MDIEKNNVLKYTFLIIPFKFEGAISEDAVTATGFYHPCDHSVIKYDRLYKHVADCIDEKNPDRTIFDFWADREHHLSDLFRNTLQFRVKNENGQFFRPKGISRICSSIVSITASAFWFSILFLTKKHL